MNLVLLIPLTLFTLFGVYSSENLSESQNPPQLPGDTHEQISLQSTKIGDSLGSYEEKKNGTKPRRKGAPVYEPEVRNSTNEVSSQDQPISTSVEKSTISKITSTAETLTTNVGDIGKTKLSETKHISTDRANTTMQLKAPIQLNGSSEQSDSKASSTVTQATGHASESEKYSTYDSKTTKTDTSASSASTSNKSNSSKSTETVSASTESTSFPKSSHKSVIKKKPTITYSVEDEPTLLNITRERQFISPLASTEMKSEGNNAAYLPPSSDFVDRIQVQNRREKYIFPLVVLIFLVPMVLGIGIVIFRRVRDYWSTRHYRRMDFLVDGMYNT